MAKGPETSIIELMQLMMQMRADDKAFEFKREQKREIRQLKRDERQR